MTKVYIAGHMLDKGAQLLRAKECADIKEIGYDIYNPADNKSINDKANAKAEGLAERIVDADTRALLSADVVVLEPQPYALGTHVELGQLLGMKDLAVLIYDEVYKHNLTNSAEEVLDKIEAICLKVLLQKVYPHMQDIRRQATSPEQGDRRSWAVNQYVYGACLKLTNGKGFYEWDEVLDELHQAKEMGW